MSIVHLSTYKLQIIQRQADKIGEMTAVMRTVAALDEESMDHENRTVQIIAQLSTENKVKYNLYFIK